MTRCLICGAEFKSYLKNAKYCSNKCKGISRRKRLFAECKNCGQKIEIQINQFKRGEGKYCSRKCKGEFMHKMLNGENGNNWKGGKCKHTGGYITISGKQLEHRAVVEKFIGRKLTSEEHIHHIDGDKTNNDISNLQILTNSEHTKLHWKNKTI